MSNSKHTVVHGKSSATVTNVDALSDQGSMGCSLSYNDQTNRREIGSEKLTPTAQHASLEDTLFQTRFNPSILGVFFEPRGNTFMALVAPKNAPFGMKHLGK